MQFSSPLLLFECPLFEMEECKEESKQPESQPQEHFFCSLSKLVEVMPENSTVEAVVTRNNRAVQLIKKIREDMD